MPCPGLSPLLSLGSICPNMISGTYDTSGSCETKPYLISAYIVKEAAVHHSAAALYRQHGYMKLTAKQKQTKVDNSGLLEISDGLQILLRLV